MDFLTMQGSWGNNAPEKETYVSMMGFGQYLTCRSGDGSHRLSQTIDLVSARR